MSYPTQLTGKSLVGCFPDGSMLLWQLKVGKKFVSAQHRRPAQGCIASFGRNGGELGVDYQVTSHETYLNEKFFKARPASATSNAKDAASIRLKSLNHIAIEAHDVDLVTEFYRSVIGFTSQPRPAFPFDGTWLHGAGLTLHIIESDPSVPEQTGAAQKSTAGISKEPWFVRRSRHLAFETDDLESAERSLQRHGVAYDKFVIPGVPGAYQLFLLDPEGNGIEIGGSADYKKIKDALSSES